MNLRHAVVLASASLCLALAPRAVAHHGPPHDEIDEFDDVALRRVAESPSKPVNWPGVVAGVGVVAVAFALARRSGALAAQAG